MFSFFGLLGGLSLFLFGMRFGSRGLQKAAGWRLRAILSSLTNNRFVGVLVGILITFITQSSSATTVMLVGFTDAGLLVLRQTLGIILGADVGTTITVQLISFKIFDFALLIIAVGFLIMTVCKTRPRQSIGQIVMGFGMIFLGMKIMAESVEPLRESPIFRIILQEGGKNPLLGVFLATAFTALIQSSGATLGLVLSLSFQGLLNLESALPLILGANIGTCATALLASSGTSVHARRVAWAHTIFKVLGVLLFLPFINGFSRIVAWTAVDLSRQIANAHSLFNVAMTLVCLPLVPLFARLVEWIVKDEKGEETFQPRHLDERVLHIPSLGLAQAMREVMRMADRAYDMLEQVMPVLKGNDEVLRQQIIAMDDQVDLLDESITAYLTRISRQELSEEESAYETALLFVVREIERIGDIVSKDLMTYAGKKIEQNFYFSHEGFHEIRDFHARVLHNVRVAIDAFATSDVKLAGELIEEDRRMADLEKELENSHLDRLRRGQAESFETSTVHLDLISDLRRVHSHATGIAMAILGRFKEREAESALRNT
jgi:phosphate:Na+ symporter